ncbi:MAG: helix-turn-helix transcriptional regulator [Ruminococcaceae bacterium]|nr:helix-turn-helix transcriptional regulator [Oscillospiraceae bacterium]
MKLTEINPFIRAAMLQPAVLQGQGAHMAYDHRLFYIIEGEGQLLLENAAHALVADTLILLPPATPYEFCGKLRVIVLNFDLTREAQDGRAPIFPPPPAEFFPSLIFSHATCKDLTYPLVQQNCRRYFDALFGIVQRFDVDSPLCDALTSAGLKLLLTELADAAHRSTHTTEDLITRIKRYIHLHAATVASIGEVAAHFGYHPVYLTSLFHAQTGKTLYAAIREERILLAKELLTVSALSIEEIALETGFYSRSHFCTAFKAREGVSPKQYRNQKKP